MSAEIEALAWTCGTLVTEITTHHTHYVDNLSRLPKTGVLNELSAGQFETLDQIMKHDKKRAERMWELYQHLQDLRAYYDFLGRVMAFREKHFTMDEQEEHGSRQARIRVADSRSFIRKMGPQLLEKLQAIKPREG